MHLIDSPSIVNSVLDQVLNGEPLFVRCQRIIDEAMERERRALAAVPTLLEQLIAQATADFERARAEALQNLTRQVLNL